MASQKTEQDLVDALNAVSPVHFQFLNRGGEFMNPRNFGCYICECMDAGKTPASIQFGVTEYPSCNICNDCAQSYPSGAIARLIPMHAFVKYGQTLSINNDAWGVYFGNVASHIVDMRFTGVALYVAFPGAHGMSKIYAPIERLTGPGVKLARSWLESNPFWQPERN